MKQKDLKRLSKDDMKHVIGGNAPEGQGGCSMSCGCSPNVSACNSASGDCQRDPSGGWIKCDGIQYTCPAPCSGH